MSGVWNRFVKEWELYQAWAHSYWEEPYQCPVCGTVFSRSIYLNKHEHTHTAEKPYQCKERGSGFSQRTHLKDYICKLISGRNYKNVNIVEQDCGGIVFLNYTHSYWRETIQMLRVWSRVFKKQWFWKPYANSYWGKSIPMQKVWSRFFRE